MPATYIVSGNIGTLAPEAVIKFRAAYHLSLEPTSKDIELLQ
jgi:hypothetical protein